MGRRSGLVVTVVERASLVVPSRSCERGETARARAAWWALDGQDGSACGRIGCAHGASSITD